jgi:hypothetical protein
MNTALRRSATIATLRRRAVFIRVSSEVAYIAEAIPSAERLAAAKGVKLRISFEPVDARVKPYTDIGSTLADAARNRNVCGIDVKRPCAAPVSGPSVLA